MICDEFDSGGEIDIEENFSFPLPHPSDDDERDPSPSPPPLSPSPSVLGALYMEIRKSLRHAVPL